MATAAQLGDGTGHIFIVDSTISYAIVPVFPNNAEGKRKVLKYLYPGVNVLNTVVARYLFYMDRTGAAVNGPPTGTNITSDLINVFLLGLPNLIQTVTNVATDIELLRTGTDSFVQVNSTGALASITSITVVDPDGGHPQQLGDTVSIWGQGAATSIVMSNGADMFCTNNAPYTSEGPWQKITFIWLTDDDTAITGWFETGRSGQQSISVQDLANASIPQGLPTTIFVTPILGGTTFTLVPRTDSQNQTLTGGPYALTGNNNFVGDAAAIAGDTFIISGGGVVVTDAGGQILIEGAIVPTQMAANGLWTAELFYDGSAWVCRSITPNMGAVPIIEDAQIFNVSGTKVTALSLPGTSIANVTIDGGAKIIPGSIPATALDADVQSALAISSGYNNRYVQFTIASADILTLFTTPLIVITSPGPGKYILIQHVSVLTYFATTAYAAFTELYLKVDDVGYSTLSTCPGALSFGSDKMFNMLISEGATDRFKNDTDVIVTVPTGDPTLGDGDIKLQIWYKIVTA